jgi:hypothetical protein
MRLDAFKLSNFRCITTTDWLRLPDVSLLVGENDSGKTAALDAVMIFFGVSQPRLEDIALLPGRAPGDSSAHTDALELHGRFALTPEELAECTTPAFTPGDQLHVCFRFTREGVRSWTLIGTVPDSEDLRVDVTARNITRESLRAILESHGVHAAAAALRPDLSAQVQQLQHDGHHVPGEVPTARPPHFDRFQLVDFRHAASPQSVIDSTLRARFQAIVTTAEQDTLEGVAARARHEMLQEVARLLPFINNYRPDVSAISAEISIDFARGFASAPLLLQNTSGESLPADRRGEGFRRQLTLAAFEWSTGALTPPADQSLIVLFDEPDTHLDYHAQQRLLAVLTRLANAGRQLIIATHSISIINTFRLDGVNLFTVDHTTSRSSGRAVIAPPMPGADEQIELSAINQIGRAIGVDNAAVLYERCFFLFEGDSEAAALPSLYELWAGTPWYLDGVRFVNAYNNDGALRFARFLRSQDRPVVALVDDDTTYNKGTRRALTQARLTADAHVDQIFTVGPTCFEMAFASSVWRRAIHEATGRRGPNDATIDKYRNNPTRFVTFLQRQMGVTSKPELAAHLARAARRRSDIPSDITDAFSAAQASAR